MLASVAHAFIFFGLWVWGIGATPLSTISTASFVSWLTQAGNDAQLFTVMLVNLYSGDGKLWAKRPFGTFCYVAGGMVLTLLALVLGVHIHGLNLTSSSRVTCALSADLQLIASNASGLYRFPVSALLSTSELYSTAGVYWSLTYAFLDPLDLDNISLGLVPLGFPM